MRSSFNDEGVNGLGMCNVFPSNMPTCRGNGGIVDDENDDAGDMMGNAGKVANRDVGVMAFVEGHDALPFVLSVGGNLKTDFLTGISITKTLESNSVRFDDVTEGLVTSLASSLAPMILARLILARLT